MGGRSRRSNLYYRYADSRSQSQSKSSFSASRSSVTQVRDHLLDSKTSSTQDLANTSRTSRTSSELTTTGSSRALNTSQESGGSRSSPRSRQRSSKEATSARKTPDKGRRPQEVEGRKTPEIRRVHELEGRRTPDQGALRRRQEVQEVVQHRRSGQESGHENAVKKSSYYFGEEPDLDTNGVEEEDDITPTDERGGVRNGELFLLKL